MKTTLTNKTILRMRVGKGEVVHTKQVKSNLTFQIHQLWLDFFCHTKCDELMIESTEYECPISCRHRRTSFFSWSILVVIFIMAEISLLIC